MQIISINEAAKLANQTTKELLVTGISKQTDTIPHEIKFYTFLEHEIKNKVPRKFFSIKKTTEDYFLYAEDDIDDYFEDDVIYETENLRKTANMLESNYNLRNEQFEDFGIFSKDQNFTTPPNMIILSKDALIKARRGDKNIKLRKGYIETQKDEFIELDLSGLTEPIIINHDDILINQTELESLTINQHASKNEAKETPTRARNSMLTIIHALVIKLEMERSLASEALGNPAPKPYEESKLSEILESIILNKFELTSPLKRSIRDYLVEAKGSIIPKKNK